MDPIQSIKLHSKTFTKNELVISDFVINNLILISTKSIVDVAKEIPTSKSALLRFCQKCDYSGYSHFKYEISRYLHSGPFNGDEKDSYINMINIYSHAVEEFKNNINFKLLNDFAKLLINSKGIKIYGVNETGLSARQLNYRLAVLGIDSEFITEEALILSKPSLYNYCNGLSIFFTLSGETDSIKKSIETCIKNGYAFAVITQNSFSKLNKKTKYSFIIPSINTNEKIMYLNPQALNFIFIELLISTISHNI